MSCWRWNGSLLTEAEIIFIEKGVTFRLVLGCPQTINNVNISRFSTSLRLVNKYWWYHQWWRIVNIYCDKPYFLVCSIFIDDVYRSSQDLFIRTMILRALNIDNKYIRIYTYCAFDGILTCNLTDELEDRRRTVRLDTNRDFCNGTMNRSK